jgi:hypothetical protein
MIAKQPLHFPNLDYVAPPRTLTELLRHPHLSHRTVEVSVFNEHRYAFYFWCKWTSVLAEKDIITAPPCLVTLDWHQDLRWPTPTQKKWLAKLDTSNKLDTSLYSWANLSGLNDEQIMAAAYLNRIGNIYVHCRQGKFEDHWKDQVYTDKYGNQHLVKKFKRFEDLETHLLMSAEQNVYFDIDLDFFTIQNPLNGIGKKFTYLSDPAIKKFLHLKRPVIEWVFKRLCGFTIALEPEHTGGLTQSNRLHDLLNQLYFKPSLFTNYGNDWKKSCKWKHQKR